MLTLFFILHRSTRIFPLSFTYLTVSVNCPQYKYKVCFVISDWKIYLAQYSLRKLKGKIRGRLLQWSKCWIIARRFLNSLLPSRLWESNLSKAINNFVLILHIIWKLYIKNVVLDCNSQWIEQCSFRNSIPTVLKASDQRKIDVF